MCVLWRGSTNTEENDIMWIWVLCSVCEISVFHRESVREMGSACACLEGELAFAATARGKPTVINTAF